MIREAACAILGTLACLAPMAGAGAQSPTAALDPAHVVLTLPADLKFEGAEGEQRAKLYGDPDKPGPYAIVYKWGAGHHSKPHSHAQDRYGYVISGTWWMSTSSVEDTKTLVPVRAGTFVVHKANEVHWDGGVDGTALVLVSGMGPIETKRVAGN